MRIGMRCSFIRGRLLTKTKFEGGVYWRGGALWKEGAKLKSYVMFVCFVVTVVVLIVARFFVCFFN